MGRAGGATGNAGGMSQPSSLWQAVMSQLPLTQLTLVGGKLVALATLHHCTPFV